MKANHLPGIDECLSDSARGMDAETKRRLPDELRGGPRPPSPEEAVKEAVAQARARALERRRMTPPAANRPDVEKAGGQFRLLDVKRPGEALQPPRMTNLNQPEIPGPGGAPIDIPDDLYQRIRADLEDEGGAGGGFEPLEGLSEAAKLVIRNFESSIRVLPREHLRVFSPDGIERYRRTGDPSSVGLDLSTLPGNVATHNHPGGMPPS